MNNKKDVFSVVLYVAFILLGGFLIFKPTFGLPQLVKLLALILLVYGIVLLVSYFVQARQYVNPQPGANRMIFYAVGIIVVGLFLFIFNRLASQVLLPTLIGIAMLAMGVLRCFAAYQLKQLGSLVWWMPLVTALISVLLGLVILVKPLESSVFFSIVLGLYLVAFGALGIGERATFRALGR